MVGLLVQPSTFWRKIHACALSSTAVFDMQVWSASRSSASLWSQAGSMRGVVALVEDGREVEQTHCGVEVEYSTGVP